VLAVVAGVAALRVYEQRGELSAAKDLPGPRWFAPFVTGVVHMCPTQPATSGTLRSPRPAIWLALSPKIVFAVPDAAGAWSTFARVSER